MGTYFAKREDSARKWYVLDADGMPVGRLAVEAAKILRGKHKPTFTPHMDCGDHVIIINAAKCIMTGANKPDELLYHHTGYPGGIKSVTRAKAMSETPVKMVMKIVKGMLPHNKLGDATFRKLRVHAGAEHNHEAQMPEILKLS